MAALPPLERQMLPRLCVAASALLLSGASFAQPVPQSPPTLGSANTVVADPSVPRPRTTPCRVQLFTDVRFADFSSKPFAYAPPAACPGPWQKVVLEADFSVEAGRQFDRTANLWIGGVNVYFGTTAEPSRTVGRSWHVERDLTDYTALLLSPAAGEADLGNLVNKTFTSSLWGSAALAFYPMPGGGRDDDSERRPPRTADLVLPMSARPTGGTVALFDPSAALAATFKLPTNVEKAWLDVVLQHQGANDEFWYTCVPNDLATALQSCTGTGFREGEVSLDGQPAGVVPIYPWIFTGGIDPLLWRPIPGVQALNFIPYRVDLTPFAGVLSDGQPHRIAIDVFNNSRFFSTTATLLVFLDHGSKQVTGAVTANTIGHPAPVLRNGLTTAADGTISGTLAITSSRSFVVAGFVKTSHGRVHTRIDQTIQFSNSQQFDVSASSAAFVQNITQRTDISSTTRVHGGGEPREVTIRMSWPLEVDISVPADGATFTTNIRQAYDRTDAFSRGGEIEFVSTVSNAVAPTDTFPTAIGQANSQRYFSADSNGACYSRRIAAAKGVLTALVDGADCEEEH
jgi:Peptide N-acetyl-beta-D-glucosaminyl asparaginase amidase A